MRYAIIADTHGNADGLEAVLKECRNENIDTYLFLGDYYNDFPRMNDGVNIIRNIPNKIVISGNKEDRLKEYSDNKENFLPRQYNALRWSYNNLSKENVDYLINLPKYYEIKDGIFTIKMTHVFSHFYDEQEPLKEMGSSYICNNYNIETIKDYSTHLKKVFLNDKKLIELYMKEKNTIYIFGHNHIATSLEIDGNYFINGGASGIRGDFSDGAGYGILDIKDGIITINNKTAFYDKQKVVENMYKSDLYIHAPIWSELVIKSFKINKESHKSFFELSHKLKEKYSDTSLGIPDYIWEEAYEILKKEGYFKT